MLRNAVSALQGTAATAASVQHPPGNGHAGPQLSGNSQTHATSTSNRTESGTMPKLAPLMYAAHRLQSKVCSGRLLCRSFHCNILQQLTGQFAKDRLKLTMSS